MTDTLKSKAPTAQRVWLVLYWVGFAVNAMLFLVGVTSSEGVTFVGLAVTAIAATAALVGAIFATRIRRSGVSTTTFVKGTTVVRAIAVAWILIGVAIWSGSIAAVVMRVAVTQVDWSTGFLGTVGSISIVAVLGPGYTEYREALAARETPS